MSRAGSGPPDKKTAAPKSPTREPAANTTTMTDSCTPEAEGRFDLSDTRRQVDGPTLGRV